MELIAQIKKISIASIIMSIVLGVLFIMFPEKCITYVSLAIGASLIILGVISIIGFLINRSGAFTLSLGIVSAIVGIIVCAKYQAIISIIVIILGILILASGIFNLFTSIKAIVSSLVFGWITLALSIVTCVFGVIAITKSGALTVTIVQFIGVALIVYAIMDILSFIQVKMLVKDVKKAVESVSDIETDATVVEDLEDVEAKTDRITELFNTPEKETPEKETEE